MNLVTENNTPRVHAGLDIIIYWLIIYASGVLVISAKVYYLNIPFPKMLKT